MPTVLQLKTAIKKGKKECPFCSPYSHLNKSKLYERAISLDLIKPSYATDGFGRKLTKTDKILIKYAETASSQPEGSIKKNKRKMQLLDFIDTLMMEPNEDIKEAYLRTAHIKLINLIDTV